MFIYIKFNLNLFKKFKFIINNIGVDIPNNFIAFNKKIFKS